MFTRIRRASGILLALWCAGAWAGEPLPAAAPDYIGRTFRIHAHYEGGRLHADRVQWRVDQDSPERVQITGVIARMDAARRRFELARTTVFWQSDTEIRDLRFQDLRDGTTVRVTAEWADDRLVASRIRAAEAVDARTVQLTGVVDEAQRLADGRTRLSLGGFEIDTRQAGFNGVESLIRRQDQRGSDFPVSRKLLGRDFGFTGKAEVQTRERRAFDLEAADQVVDTEATLEVGAYFRPGARTTLYAAAQLAYSADLLRLGGRREPPDTRIERDQSWIYFERLGGSGFGLQLGRQNFKETREWWWDDDLDAARLYYDRGPFHAEFALARELAPLSNKDSEIDAEQQDVVRTLGQLSWLWAPRQKLEFFFLRNDDRSARGVIGEIVAAEREDDSDARLTWYGLRASGMREFRRFGTINYWADQAWVRGEETQTRYRDAAAGSQIDRVRDIDVSGRGLDLGFSWQAPWRLPLSLGLGYARGSAGPANGDIDDGGFRQTGLHRNKTRYFGVNRYRSYGEVLRPELSNLAVQSARIGLPLRRNSSVELAWHRYRQLTPTDSLRDGRIETELTGLDTDVGSALDLVIGLRDSRHVDVEVTLGLFRAGAAFGAQRGEVARQIALEAAWNF
jgi:alginate production protein